MLKVFLCNDFLWDHSFTIQQHSTNMALSLSLFSMRWSVISHHITRKLIVRLSHNSQPLFLYYFFNGSTVHSPQWARYWVLCIVYCTYRMLKLVRWHFKIEESTTIYLLNYYYWTLDSNSTWSFKTSQRTVHNKSKHLYFIIIFNRHYQVRFINYNSRLIPVFIAVPFIWMNLLAHLWEWIKSNPNLRVRGEKDLFHERQEERF